MPTREVFIFMELLIKKRKGKRKKGGGVRGGELLRPCSLRAVKTMVPVSSPMRHSAMRVGRRVWEGEGRPFCKTVLEDNTLATKV